LTFEFNPGSLGSTTKTVGTFGWRSATRRATGNAGSSAEAKEKTIS
jgi:hypothetical protein